MEIELVEVDFSKEYFLTLAELVEINEESRQARLPTTLADETIARLTKDSMIQALGADRYTPATGESFFRVAFVLGTSGRFDPLDVTLAAWERILQSGRAKPPLPPLEPMPILDDDAYGQGYSHYCAGETSSDNPYDAKEEPLAHHAWEEGWRKGRLDDNDECEQLTVMLAEAGPQGMTQADLFSKLDYLEVPRLCFLLDDLIRRGHISVSQASDGVIVYRRLSKDGEAE